MQEIRTEITIDAPAEQVWQILTDFAAFPHWNPFMRSARGELRAGGQLTVRLQPSGGRAMTFRPRVLRADPGRELRWLGHLLVPGIFDGEHILAIEPLAANRVRFVQREVFTGVLAPLVLRLIGSQTRRGFMEMNQALKERAETAARAEPAGS